MKLETQPLSIRIIPDMGEIEEKVPRTLILGGTTGEVNPVVIHEVKT
jgi:hypothetical protein